MNCDHDHDRRSALYRRAMWWALLWSRRVGEGPYNARAAEHGRRAWAREEKIRHREQSSIVVACLHRWINVCEVCGKIDLRPVVGLQGRAS